MARATLAVLGLVAALAPAAAAAHRTVVYHPHAELDLVAAGTNDYSIGIFGRSPDRVSVQAETPVDRVAYELPARMEGNLLEARFGDVIDVSVLFHPGPHRRVNRRRGRCTGRSPEVRWGEFTGTIEFHGELGYSEFVATSHKGLSWRFFKQVCRLPPRASASSIGPPAKQLVAGRAEGSASTSFRAMTGIAHPKPYPQWLFGATHGEWVGEVEIHREVMVEAETGGALSEVGVTPALAGVAPPAPFFGVAEFHEGAGAQAWTGSLGVDLPGLGPIPLTGEGFTARTCIGLLKGAKPCERAPFGTAPV